VAYQGSLVVRLPLRFSLVFPLALSVLDLRYMRLPFLIQFSHRLGLPFVLVPWDEVMGGGLSGGTAVSV